MGGGGEVEAGLFGGEYHAAVGEEEGGDARVTVGLGGVEGRVGVAQTQEFFQFADMFAYLHYLKARVILGCYLHVGAVRTCIHHINLNHIIVFFLTGISI